MTQISTVIWESISNSISEIFPISVLLPYHISNQCSLQSRNQVLRCATSKGWQVIFKHKTKVEYSRSPGVPVFCFSFLFSLPIFLSSSPSDSLCFLCSFVCISFDFHSPFLCLFRNTGLLVYIGFFFCFVLYRIKFMQQFLKDFILYPHYILFGLRRWSPLW